MHQPQWRVLYRQFLFRVFDLEGLSAQAQGDSHRLLGQFAALLVVASIWLSPGIAGLSDPNLPGNAPGGIGLVYLMVAQHFVIATTMLAVGLFAVLSWDATYPDRLDVLVLAPLPLRARTMFLAKVAAVASALGLTILLLHCGMGLFLPPVFAARAVPATLPAMTFDAPQHPVPIPDMTAVMDRDLHQQLTTGELRPGSGAGLAIGVLKHGERRVFAYGTAKPDSLFEIGSISKTFTGLILARMVEQGQVRLDEPVRELLPPGTVAKPAGQEITLLDLATHHSGLPRMPSNFHPADPDNPYADYGPQQLYAYLKSHGLAKPDDATYLYSNLGAALLGQALSVRAGRSYADELRKEITGPLNLRDTVVQLSGDQQRRFLQGHDDRHRPVHEWDLNAAFAGAGGIRSTAGDMLAYLEANLHPEKYASLAGPLAFSHRLHDNAAAGEEIALVWNYEPGTGTYSHSGATGGFTSEAFFNPRGDWAVLALVNGEFSLLSPDVIVHHLQQRLLGEPGISLDSVQVPAIGGFRGVWRSYGVYWFTMLAAGMFIYGAILGMQGLAALMLPRRWFLRLSGYLQLAVICLIVGVYFLQPGLGGLNGLGVASIYQVIQFLPSYWFLGLYQQLDGSMHPLLQPLAIRAWIGLAAVVCLTPVVYTLSYWRTLRKIVEEPDIAPASRRRGFLPRFGTQPRTAIVHFTARTLARSKQHRLILGFYVGIALAFTSLMVKGSPSSLSNPWREKSLLLWGASMMLLVLAVAGTRVAFALPLDLRANWIFRVIGVRSDAGNLAATRSSLLVLAVIPVWLVTAAFCLGFWPGWRNAGHLLALAFLGLILADLCLLGFHKIPFTCSYLPGRSRFHMAFFGAFVLLWIGSEAATLERHVLRHARSAALMLVLLAGVWVALRLTIDARSAKGGQDLRFEEEDSAAVQRLGLNA